MNLSEVIQGCQSNERKAQALMYEHTSDTVMNVCLRYASNQYEADDMFQEAFIHLFKKIGTFDATRQDANFMGWVYRLTANVALKLIKKKTKLDHDELEDHESNEKMTEVLPDTIEAEELQGFIRQLPSGQRVVFNLFAIDGYSHEEIAKMLGVNVVTSRSHLFKARARLQKMHQEYYSVNE